MNKFLGGFASAALLLATAAAGGPRWLDAGLALSLLIPLGWLMARTLRRRGTAPQPGPDPGARPFGAREERGGTVKRR